MALVSYTLEAHTALLTMGAGQNLLSTAFMGELLAVLHHLEQDTQATALVLTSQHDRFFSNGFDLNGLKAAPGPDRYLKETLTVLNTLFRRLLTYPLLTIAAINGHAFAAGALLACACDYRLMNRDRGFFCLPEIDLGLPLLPSAMALLRKAAPAYLADDLVYSGRRLTGLEAEEHRLAHKSCPASELGQAALDMARSLDKSRPAVAALKTLANAAIIDLIDKVDPTHLDGVVEAFGRIAHPQA
jgi:enoyl-CoA hydratase/carnithine racemase